MLWVLVMHDFGRTEPPLFIRSEISRWSRVSKKHKFVDIAYESRKQNPKLVKHKTYSNDH